jgi:hypothetical protein
MAWKLPPMAVDTSVDWSTVWILTSIPTSESWLWMISARASRVGSAWTVSVNEALPPLPT